MYVLYISLQIIPIYGDEGKKGENICTNDIRIIYTLVIIFVFFGMLVL